MSSKDRDLVESMLADVNVDIDNIPYTAPPGEEGMDFSHEGGEHEAFEGLAQQMADLSGCIQAQCKALCHLHNIPYQSYLNTQFLDACDIYLEILHCVDILINKALNRNTPNWRLLNSCPCCFYKLEDEEPLALEWLVTMDGNNSLKRWTSSTADGTTTRNDSCRFRSDYWLDRLTVDKFKDEVQGRTVEQCKRMFAVFDESGIFIAACQHRFILLACDMIKSGELVKYPLAMVDKLLTVYSRNGGCVYDIGCTFAKTLGNSSLGPCTSALNFRMMVGAFHGHAHNRRCQIDWHPMYIEGTGHTEGEGCEHIFSSSNELARSTQHATTFHRHQSIEQHFTFWDEDKYAALSVFLRNHYQEALTAILTLTAELSAIQETLNLTNADFVRFHVQEHEYLDGLKQAPVKDHLSVRYVNVLDKLAERHDMHLAINQAQVRIDTAYSKLQNMEEIAGHLEVQLGIDKQEALLLKYRSALNELECLVVMRLFELSKLSLSGTDAIQNTINRYNTQAATLVPPRPTLAWKDIVEYSFLGEFDLLRQSRTDIRDADWTAPAHREATVKYFKLQRAHEEIQHLNIEVRHLHTAIHDEQIKTDATIDELLVTNPPLAAELRRRWQARAAINAVHLYQLCRIKSLPAFSGRRGIGV
ncbi:uncharacterized protein EDB91DRAFT_1235645 [Suillus paluster]|uniref:uncharacterized protein n=1 Tax=Suillus paluster TaxID=48578 RepID=UPI001B8855DC|nr:uncharacterized protein EDB91DRAFT_1235645 [Suillus paluster]KAG1749166.1 hypothetical protein EDB91DRAFT_1235645 [Suillus paluster]